MGSLGLPHILIMLVAVVVILLTGRQRWQIYEELNRTAIHSAETTHGKEAQFIRDQLPKRSPIIIAFVVAAMVCTVAWWLTR